MISWFVRYLGSCDDKATVLVVVPRGGSPPALSHYEATDVDRTGRVNGQLRFRLI